jgi:hypothetical protein
VDSRGAFSTILLKLALFCPAPERYIKKEALHTGRDKTDILNHTAALILSVEDICFYFLDVYVSRELKYEEDFILVQPFSIVWLGPLVHRISSLVFLSFLKILRSMTTGKYKRG